MFGDPFSNPFGWEKKKLEDTIIETPQNGLYKPTSFYTKNQGGVPILRIDSFYDGKIEDVHNLRRIVCSKKEIGKFKLENGDIVINRVNSIEYLGKCALVENLTEPTVFESNMMRIRFNTDLINPVYLTKLLCTKYVYHQILTKAKKAVNQASINQKDVGTLDIIVPTLKLQNKFAEIVEQVEQMREYQKQSKHQIDNLFSTLMQKAFRGELAC